MKNLKLLKLILLIFLLAFSTAFAVIAPNIYTDKPPGETIKLKRPYKGAPPFIPHSIADFNITRSSNDCLGCHQEGVELSKDHRATKIPPSHYINRYTGERKKEEVQGIRYNCLQCHVPQSMDEEK